MRRSTSLWNTQHLLLRTKPTPLPACSSPFLLRPSSSIALRPVQLPRLVRAVPKRSSYTTATRNSALQSSYTSYTVAFIIVTCGCVFGSDYLNRSDPNPEADATRTTTESSPTDSHDPFFTNMPIVPGHRGNLTAEQEVKLRELWVLTLKTFGVQDPSIPNGTSTPAEVEDTPTNSEPETKEKKKKSGMRGMFSRKHDDHSTSAGSSSNSPRMSIADDSDDKYGQVKEYHQILSTQTPESLRDAFWSMVKSDHPDALLLRFLRARKWDVGKALVMLISTMSWRGNEMHVDDDVIYQGEAGAMKDSQSSDASVKKEGHDFLEQMRLGKSFLHGTDKEGRPLCIVRARLHHGGDQTEKSMERYTVYVIETARLVLRPPVETAVSVLQHCFHPLQSIDLPRQH